MSRGKKILIIVVVHVVGLAGLHVYRAGYTTRAQAEVGRSDHDHDHDHEEQSQQQYTCSMHPQIRRNEPGICPICNMDLVPVEDDGGLGEREISFSPEALALMDVETYTVQRRYPEARIRLNGKVAYDETRVKYITSWISGRIDRMFADFTGTTVEKGDHMVEIYSPELLSAQAELLQALRASENQEQNARLGAGPAGTLSSARSRLRLLGLTERQIQAIEASGEPMEHLTIHAPIGGVVIERVASQGQYVNVGDPIYRIADFSHLWVELDIYESDMMWLRYGQEVDFTIQAYPGQVFTGRISFIDPRLDQSTRTVKARVDVPNPDGRLRPGMFVSAIVSARVAQGGRVMEDDLAGKWISPMHPSVIKDGPGQCDVCGMDLVPIEALGYATAEKTEPPLIIPASSALITGKRAIVYVRHDDQQGRYVFEGKEVVLGPRAGDYYLVASGLEEGQRVVTRGNFKIDSALQIQAKTSMMSYPGGQVIAGITDQQAQREIDEKLGPQGVPRYFREHLAHVVYDYLEVSDTLADDELQTAQAQAQQMLENYRTLDTDTLGPEAYDLWLENAQPLPGALEALIEAGDFDRAREAFDIVSNKMIEIARVFEPTEPQELYVIYCPMAFDDTGAHWLSADDQVRNPYFGAMMYACGEVDEKLGEDDRPAVRTDPGPVEHQH